MNTDGKRDGEHVALLEAVAAQLAEYFDSVQILCTYTENGRTVGLKRGRGDWYARYGIAHEFINEQQAAEVGAAVSECLPGDEPDDEAPWKPAGG